jgi:adenylate cyclase
MSTGEAFVGDYGSNAKLDYTCIGDTINLGSRLEQLNKILGATVLVDAQTRTMAGNELSFRPLGRIRIHGRSAPAEVFEMLVGPAVQEYAAGDFQTTWNRVISSYQACQWDICKEALSACRRQRPLDKPATLYGASVDRVLNRGLPQDWDGALDVEVLVGMQRATGA